MFGIRFIKVDPTEFVMKIKAGKVVREGAGLSFFYYAPTTSLLRIPVGTVDVPFIFEEVTADFQAITVQGQITYQVAEPRKLAHCMNFALTPNAKNHVSEDPKKLPQRLINHAQVITSVLLKALSLREALRRSETFVSALRDGLRANDSILSLGVEILDVAILAVKPTPETARALEAEVRERLLREADEAVYARRNAAVEQERAIKENELNTEIAVENKKRQIRETQMEAEKSVQRKQHELKEAEMSANIALEARNNELVALQSANARTEAEAKAYAMSAIMQSFAQTDPKILQALTAGGMAPGQLVALAFRELAENSDKIGQLNISPELLRELLANSRK